MLGCSQLMDEACSSVRVQLDSQPEVIDRLERKQMTLEVEATALSGEKQDAATKARLAEVWFVHTSSLQDG